MIKDVISDIYPFGVSKRFFQTRLTDYKQMNIFEFPYFLEMWNIRLEMMQKINKIKNKMVITQRNDIAFRYARYNSYKKSNEDVNKHRMNEHVCFMSVCFYHDWNCYNTLWQMKNCIFFYTLYFINIYVTLKTYYDNSFVVKPWHKKRLFSVLCQMFSLPNGQLFYFQQMSILNKK